MQEAEYEYAGFWVRAAASLLDMILLLSLSLTLLLSIYGKAYFNMVQFGSTAGPADFFITWALPMIVVVMFWRRKKATPGKMLISAKVVDEKTGRSMTLAQAIGRYLAYFVSLLPFGLGFLWIAFDRKKQGWHDKLAGTVVVIAKNGGSTTGIFQQAQSR